ncbi:MAG: hypothetical protein ACWGQW_25455, partial [bacterium]
MNARIRMFGLCIGLLWCSLSWGAKTDMQMFVNDLQRMVQDGQKMSLVWWIPNEYWEVLSENDPAMSGELASRFVSVVDDYLIFVVIDAKVGPFGGVTSKPRSEVLTNLRVDLKKGIALSP